MGSKHALYLPNDARGGGNGKSYSQRTADLFRGAFLENSIMSDRKWRNPIHAYLERRDEQLKKNQIAELFDRPCVF